MWLDHSKLSSEKKYVVIEKSSLQCCVFGNENQSFWNCIYNSNRFTISGWWIKLCQQDFLVLVQIHVEKAPNWILLGCNILKYVPAFTARRHFYHSSFERCGEWSSSKLGNIQCVTCKYFFLIFICSTSINCVNFLLHLYDFRRSLSLNHP